jgi:hypothetical protein
MGADAVLNDLWGDVLATRGDDEVLLATGDAQIAVGVKFADVAGAEPALGIEVLLGGLVVAPVALEDDVALDQDLAVVLDADCGSGRLTVAAAVVSVRP